jgi:hypothetical protein
MRQHHIPEDLNPVSNFFDICHHQIVTQITDIKRNLLIQYSTQFWNSHNSELEHTGSTLQQKLLSDTELVCSLNFHDEPVKQLAGDDHVTATVT